MEILKIIKALKCGKLCSHPIEKAWVTKTSGEVIEDEGSLESLSAAFFCLSIAFFLSLSGEQYFAHLSLSVSSFQ